MAGGTQVEVEPGAVSQIAAAALAVVGFVLAEKYFTIGDDMMNKAKDVAERIDAIEEELFDCYCLVQHPQKELVMNAVYDWAVPDVDPAAITSRFDTAMDSKFCPAVSRGEEVLLERYNCTSAWHPCDKGVEIYCAEAKTFAATWYTAALYRRQEFHERLKQAESSKVYQATQDDPGAIFRMLSNAQRGYTQMGLNALNAGDALVGLAGGALGFGLTGIFNG